MWPAAFVTGWGQSCVLTRPPPIPAGRCARRSQLCMSMDERDMQISRTFSRRNILSGACILGLSAMLASARHAKAAEERPGLPPGAQQYNNLRSAIMQWDQVGTRLANSSIELAEDEWENLRGYLRIFFRVGDDMEFLSSRWDSSRKDRVKRIMKDIRKIVKEMDKSAISRDKADFAAKHAQVASLLNEFYVMFRDATVSDIPEDL